MDTEVNKDTKVSSPLPMEVDTEIKMNTEVKKETKVPVPLPTELDMIFGQKRAQIQCSKCHQQITTRVEASVSSDGWLFACCCCLFGSSLTSLLVKIYVCPKSYVSIKCPILGLLFSGLPGVLPLLPPV